MTKAEDRKEVFNHWNSKGIIVHKRMNAEIEKRINAALVSYTLDEIKATIDFYATILEPGVPLNERKYWWGYRWNLSEFCMRGIRKFDGQDLENYRHRQRIETPEAIVFKREK